MKNEYIVKKPAFPEEKVEFVMIRQGETGYHALDEVTRHNREFAEMFNKAQGHTDKDLQKALHCSFSGNWDGITLQKSN
jgi:hypothetical protein|tara:strand:- start:503 stop:739 length:237 start_codon:yes stop_codon:yes gene_type:complete